MCVCVCVYIIILKDYSRKVLVYSSVFLTCISISTD